MKILITNYTFNASAKTITFNSYQTISLASILLITNENTNPPTIVYNFAASNGTVSGNVLTLTYNTTAMSNTDPLQIYYDDVAIAASTQADQLIQEDLLTQLITSVNQLAKMQIALAGASIQVQLQANAANPSIGNINTITTLPTLANVTTVGTVTTASTVTNVAQLGGVVANQAIEDWQRIAAFNLISQIYYS